MFDSQLPSHFPHPRSSMRGLKQFSPTFQLPPSSKDFGGRRTLAHSLACFKSWLQNEQDYLHKEFFSSQEMGDLNISFLESNEFIRHVRSSPLTKICSCDDTDGVRQGCFWKICPSKESIAARTSLSLSRPRRGMHHFCLETRGQTDMRSSLKVTGVAYIILDNCK